MLNNKFNTEKVNEFLESLMNLSYNTKCADCGKPNPSWADLKHSFFICYECSALHRRLGTEKSKVKSIELDGWSIEELRRMYVGGNRYSSRVPHNSDFSIKYKDTTGFIEYLNNKEKISRETEPNEAFMNVSRPTGLKKESTIIEKKAKPRFSDQIESSSEEETINQPYKAIVESKPVKNDPEPQSDEEECKLTISKPTQKMKKTIKPSRSPFSFSIKEHSDSEINEK